MRYRITVMIIVFLLLWLWLTTGGHSAATPDATEPWTEFLAAITTVFEQFAYLDHAFQEWLWQAMSGELRAVLGALRCFNLFLALWGLFALRLLVNVGRRVF